MHTESNDELRDELREVLEGVVMSLDASSLSVGFSSKARRTLHTIADGLHKMNYPCVFIANLKPCKITIFPKMGVYDLKKRA